MYRISQSDKPPSHKVQQKHPDPDKKGNGISYRDGAKIVLFIWHSTIQVKSFNNRSLNELTVKIGSWNGLDAK